MTPNGNVTYVSAPTATFTVAEFKPPSSLTVTLTVASPGLSRWMLSLEKPVEALSNQLTKLEPDARAALEAQTSLKVFWNCTRCEARTAGPAVTGTFPRAALMANGAEASGAAPS